MSEFTAIDLSQLPAPDVIEPIDYEAILASMLADLQKRDSRFTALVESDPAMKILEVCAYREMLIRQQFNERAKAVMLAYAVGGDLDHLGANYGVKRKVIKPADDNQVPPTPPVMEADEDFRRRIQLGPEGYSTAGPVGAYLAHAHNAHDQIADVSVYSDEPGEVIITFLRRSLADEADMAPDDEIKQVLLTALNDEDVRPLTDHITVQAAEIIDYSVSAKLHVQQGPSSKAIIDTATSALNEYVEQCYKLGKTVALSGIYDALHMGGVTRVELLSPTADIQAKVFQAPKAKSISIKIA
ncbi:baseplate assembly protein [Spartinivicinus poritis]|uniref:Baseplate J/gp47 family protein n=1 Tax=Spartinivicinus poritis TaxID=2994640 RepID=A0ABT5UHC8_9GAMM|nr:baseplate J/gp47 family protein [Spartinivicinus sp. A2-2]MDE1465802.1 baseplate J/gp47 family protein [Spartinivicinus sp. A2-2]